QRVDFGGEIECQASQRIAAEKEGDNRDVKNICADTTARDRPGLLPAERDGLVARLHRWSPKDAKRISTIGGLCLPMVNGALTERFYDAFYMAFGADVGPDTVDRSVVPDE